MGPFSSRLPSAVWNLGYSVEATGRVVGDAPDIKASFQASVAMTGSLADALITV